jgi:hypothetical protein
MIKEKMMTKEIKPKRDSRKKGIELEKVFELRFINKLTCQQIGDLLGCSQQNIYNLLKKHFPELKNLDFFKEHKADLLAAKQAGILFSLSEEDIKKANLRDKATTFGILYDKERLERDESTENISIKQQIRKIKDIDKEIARLERELECFELEDEREED